MQSTIRFSTIGLLGLAISGFASAQDVTGAGASFPAPLYAKWAADYNKATGTKINYQSVGSGAGLKQIEAKTVDFGASDAPLKDADLEAKGLLQFPTVIGGVIPVVNIPGIKAGELKLSGQVLGDIYLGKITKWNDPAIAALNSGLKLPDAAIAPVRRADGSGTSFLFTNYLSKVNAEWKDKVGEGTSVQWPGGVGGKGNEGVASYVKQIKNSIGYVELAYALQSAMPYTAMQNAAGQWVQPNDESFAAAAESADWANAKDFNLVITNAPGEKSWPITATNFILMYKQPKNAAGARNAKTFFQWVYANGDAQARQLDYVPLPDALVKQIEAYWAQHMKY